MRWSRIIAVLILLVVALLVAGFITALQPKDPSSEVKTDFTIEANQATADVAKSLQEKSIIKNAFAFSLYIKATQGKLLPGIYELSASQSGSDIAGIIASGKFKVVKITIPEGWRVTQMAEYFQEKKLTDISDFTDKAIQYEGYLFPDTYEVRADITSDQLIEKMRDNYKARTEGLKLSSENVILASIVEREAKTDQERPQIAVVYLNRLKQGMKLEADPTVQYAKGNWAAPTIEDYKSVQSSYNTYLHEGLPPGAICNPGLASLNAVLNPSQSDYLYFFHAKGEIYFSKTLAEHQKKVKQYF